MSRWIEEIILTTFRNRHHVLYCPGAEQRVVKSAIDRYWLGHFTTDERFIDFIEAEMKREEI